MMLNDKILVTRSLMPSYERYIEKIKPLWENHWITNMGDYHNELEIKLQKYLKVKHLSLMSSGHMSLEMAIQVMDFPEGSEVITTPFTFISTTHAIIRNKLTPVFCDINPDDYTIDVTKIEALITEKTVAIVPVHVYGNICDVKKIEEIAYKYGLKVIYDAAHAFGEEYNGKGIGSFGDISIFSFHATKIFNTIEGGAVCYRQEEIGERLYNLKNFGIRGEELVVSVGANAKMNEFEAVMGLCNLEIVEEEIKKRKKVANIYSSCLKDINGIKINDFDKQCEKRNYGYYPIAVNCEISGVSRNDIYNKLKEENIYTRKYFYPLTSEQACFKNKWKDIEIPVARECSEQILALPIYGDLKEEDVYRICDLIRKMFNKS